MKVLKIITITIALTLIVIFISQFEKTNQENMVSALEQTINDKIMLCFINEGRYPPSLEYLEENYNLSFDETKYKVFMIPIGENIKPDLTVFAYE